MGYKRSGDHKKGSLGRVYFSTDESAYRMDYGDSNGIGLVKSIIQEI